MTKSIASILSKSQGILKTLEASNATLEAELLLAEILQKNRAFLYAWPEKQISNGQLEQFNTLLERRLKGEPLAYILERQAFWDFDLKVSPAVLIPRPETELLVELALEKGSSQEAISMIDLGTGSGAIAAAIAKERPTWHVIAIEKSKASLAVAKANFAQLKCTHIQLQQGDWLTDFDSTNIPFPIKLIISNPPYIEENDPHLIQNGLNYEPQHALISGKDGLSDIRLIATQAKKIFTLSGWLLLEHGYQQAIAVAKILKEQHFKSIQTYPDLAGLDRVTLGYYDFNEN